MEYVSNGELLEYAFPAKYEEPKAFVVLSGKVQVITGRAFDNYGTDEIQYLMLPKSLRKIEANAFVHCTGLKSLVIPKETACLEPRSVGYDHRGEKIGDFRIYGERGTEAERYAHENGFRFCPVEEVRALFDDFTLDHYSSDAVNKELNEMFDRHFDLTVPDGNEEAKQLMEEALDIFSTDFDRAYRCLCKAHEVCFPYDGEHYFSVWRLEPPEREIYYHITNLIHYIYNCRAAEAGRRGDWQTARESFIRAYQSLCDDDYREKIDGRKYKETQRQLCKAIGTTSILLGDPVDALFWLEQETEFADKFHNIFARLSFVEKMADAALLYGHVEAAVFLCRVANEIAKRRVFAGSYADKPYDHRRSRKWGYMHYRLGLLTNDFIALDIACQEFEQYRSFTPDLTEAEREKADADLAHIMRIRDRMLHGQKGE